jgi:hypothetical protein
MVKRLEYGGHFEHVLLIVGTGHYVEKVVKINSFGFVCVQFMEHEKYAYRCRFQSKPNLTMADFSSKLYEILYIEVRSFLHRHGRTDQRPF